MKIRITCDIKSWLGVLRGEIYPAKMEIGNHGRYYTMTNKARRIVDVPDWAAVVETREVKC